MTFGTRVLTLGCAALAVVVAAASGLAQSDEVDFKSFAVHVNRMPQQPWPGYGIYLGNGLILTAAHVPGNVAQTKPHVVIAGEDLPASLVRQGELEGVDLTLLSIDAANAAVRTRPLWRRIGRRGHSRRNSAFQRSASPSDPGGVARAVRHRHRRRRHHWKFLLRIISRKISVVQQELKLGMIPVRTTRDIAKYSVPAPAIKAFIPESVSF